MAEEKKTTKKSTSKPKVVQDDTKQSVQSASETVKKTAQEQAAEAKQAATEAVNQAKTEAKTRFEDAKSQAQQRASEEVETRKQQASGALGQTASDLRRAAGDAEQNWMSSAFETAASQLENVSRSIENKSPSELQQTVRNAARNHPGLFLAGCFAAGVAISRTLRVAGEEAFEDDYDGGRRAGTPATTSYAANAPARTTGSSYGAAAGTTGTAGTTVSSDTTRR